MNILGLFFVTIASSQLTMMDLHAVTANGLSRLPRTFMSKSACGVPCQRFPHPIRRKQLIKIVSNAIHVPVNSLRLVGPKELIGRNYVDIGSCMGNCVNTFVSSYTQTTCQVSEKQDLYVEVDGQEVVIPDLLVKSCQCGLSFNCGATSNRDVN